LKGTIGVTGTPGTGKKSISPLLADELGIGSLSLNLLAKSLGFTKKTPDEEEVDVGGLGRKLSLTEPVVLYGHLVPYVLDRDSVSTVVVLRCDPAILKTRLVARGYSADKTVENVEAELIGVVSADAFDAFGKTKVFEFDSTRTTPENAADKIASVIRGTAKAPRRLDWTRSYDSGTKLRSLLSAGGA
jgi:adenylate kinase